MTTRRFNLPALFAALAMSFTTLLGATSMAFDTPVPHSFLAQEQAQQADQAA